MRSTKTSAVVAFVAAGVLSTLAAAHRWGDSGHAIGLIKARGGGVRHPVVLEGGRDSYAVIATATVLPPYRGDTRVVLEGEPAIDHELYLSQAVVDFHLPRRPALKDHTLYGLEPGDRLALWLMLRPSPRTPAVGRYKLAFYDTETGNSVLDIPVILREGTADADEQAH